MKRASHVLTGCMLAAGFALAACPGARAQGILKVGMTAADLPITTGNPDQGFEGYRFVGYNLYDSLIEWDLSSATNPSELVPGLATAWHVDPKDETRWIFDLPCGPFARFSPRNRSFTSLRCP